MNIQRINATLTRAIERFQAGELASLWEVMVPTPYKMHLKHGMQLPDTGPASEGEKYFIRTVNRKGGSWTSEGPTNSPPFPNDS